MLVASKCGNKPDNQGGSSSGDTSRDTTTFGDNVFDFGMLEIGIVFHLAVTQHRMHILFR